MAENPGEANLRTIQEVENNFMKKHFKKYTDNKLKILLIGILFALPIAYYLSPTLTTAQQPPLATIFSPASGDLKTDEEKIIKLTLSSDSQISGLTLKFQTSGGLTVTDFRDALETDNNLNPFEYKQLSETSGVSNPEVSYIFTNPTQNLPKVINLYMKIKGTTTGQGKITLDYNTSQVLTGSGNLSQIAPNQSAEFNLNLNQSSPNFIDLSSIPAINYPSNTATINLKLKLLGSAAAAGTKLKATAVAVGRVGDAKYETPIREFDLFAVGNNLFSGTVAFPNFKDGTKFSLMLKVDNYLLRRICASDASETKPGEYSCADPKLTIRQGNNSFDFSGVSLLPGDLGQTDGLLNGYDLSIVRNNLNKNTKEAVSLADLNYDGQVDQKDFDLIQFVAGSTGREADQ